MNIFQQFQRTIIKNYLLGSFIAVFGVGSVFIFQTLSLKQDELFAMGSIIFLSIITMFGFEFSVYQKHIRPIKRIYKREGTPELPLLLAAYQQAEKFPLLTVKRILLPHFLGLALPSTLLTVLFISGGGLSIPYSYIFYAWCGAFLVAILHALIEFFLTFKACHWLQGDLIRETIETYGVDPSSQSTVFISLKRKILAASLFLALFPILLFSLASQIRLSIAGSTLLVDYWKWAGSLILIITLLAFYGALLIFKSIEAPVKELVNRFEKVEKGDMAPVVNTYTDEFSHLFSGFNHMVEAINLRDQKNQQLLDQFFAVVAGTLDARDPYTAGHSKRVAEYSVLIAKQCKWLVKDIDLLNKSALLHDIGKIGIRDDVLLKEGKLTDEEFAQIKRHPTIGEEIVKGVQLTEELLPILPGIKHHHERVDGVGYPDQLKGDEIPVFGRLIAVADAFDAMTSDRPYRKGMPFEKAFSILIEGKGTQWDEEFVDAFLEGMEFKNSRQTG
ncbi:HD-GYP domain-containing protein [Bacillus sp. BHET2]|uniref:HD-GYP domain-containing protein n=1 Tax=Bacillus sp. BHET2 TaxID=2583818 RepID=UPI00110F3BC8|nr:HD-GYP domain-containing protein [Bacillus sp. BHET2]TMU88147.1 HD-GYP domain-containing protein [Bacillus sp. BHET2]